MKILFTGGGTGGSVTPLLALQERFRRRYPRCQFVFVGTTDGPEQRLAESWTIPYHAIASGKLRRYASAQNLLDPFRVLKGFVQSLRILSDEQPDIVVSAGSYVSVPVVWAAWLKRLPIIVHQQDVRIGLANRLVAPFAMTITTAYEQTVGAFNPGKTIWTGNPIREDILTAKRELGKEIFHLQDDLPTILVFGGGTGARKINQLMAEGVSQLVQKAQVIHLTGRGRGGVDINHPRYHQYEFLTDTMGEAYAVADIVVCRAGLATVSELSALGKPAIILPIPETHQELNARFLADHRAAVVLDQRTLTVDAFVHDILSLASDEIWKQQLSENMLRLTHQDAAESMVREIDRLLPPKDLSSFHRIHFAGIGGVGMAGAARILHDRGYAISGSDRSASPITQDLIDRGVAVLIEDAENETLPDGVDLLVYSAAVQSHAPLRRQAFDRRLDQIPYAALLEQLIRGMRAIGISGTHGKTTTTAMLGEMVTAAHKDPTVLVGSRVRSFQGNARNGNSDLFIFEADEFARSFLSYTPTMAVITNIDVDHLDTYHDIHDIITAFRQYVSRIPRSGVIIANRDDEHVVAALDTARARIVTFGLKAGDIRATHVELKRDGTSFRVGKQIFSLQVLGEHNVMNALAAIAAGRQLGLPMAEMAKGLRVFHGTWRRFEYIGEYRGRPIISDYAHHPREIEATIATARQRFPEKRLLVVFQPHHRKRTEQLYYGFLDVLQQLDALILTEIYDVPGREAQATVSGKTMVDELKKKRHHVWYAETPANAMSLVKRHSRADDVILVLGAGDIYAAVNALVE